MGFGYPATNNACPAFIAKKHADPVMAINISIAMRVVLLRRKRAHLVSLSSRYSCCPDNAHPRHAQYNAKAKAKISRLVDPKRAELGITPTKNRNTLRTRATTATAIVGRLNPRYLLNSSIHV
ncbi:hypothetical protein GCM10008927_27070 [Amylibacter ulvae]|uniref:Uncharacterized protein n=1 Tax=Paramylibacter ulvae TaxID=1651968 RepID=A0ABQ3D803_9RHOB|nr:hypothetical protein GCM10008927_27070 [Amylibacter ulvae]